MQLKTDHPSPVLGAMGLLGDLNAAPAVFNGAGDASVALNATMVEDPFVHTPQASSKEPDGISSYPFYWSPFQPSCRLNDASPYQTSGLTEASKIASITMPMNAILPCRILPQKPRSREAANAANPAHFRPAAQSQNPSLLRHFPADNHQLPNQHTT